MTARRAGMLFVLQALVGSTCGSSLPAPESWFMFGWNVTMPPAAWAPWTSIVQPLSEQKDAQVATPVVLDCDACQRKQIEELQADLRKVQADLRKAKEKLGASRMLGRLTSARLDALTKAWKAKQHETRERLDNATVQIPHQNSTCHESPLFLALRTLFAPVFVVLLVCCTRQTKSQRQDSSTEVSGARHENPLGHQLPSVVSPSDFLSPKAWTDSQNEAAADEKTAPEDPEGEGAEGAAAAIRTPTLAAVTSPKSPDPLVAAAMTQDPEGEGAGGAAAAIRTPAPLADVTSPNSPDPLVAAAKTPPELAPACTPSASEKGLTPLPAESRARSVQTDKVTPPQVPKVRVGVRQQTNRALADQEPVPDASPRPASQVRNRRSGMRTPEASPMGVGRPVQLSVLGVERYKERSVRKPGLLKPGSVGKVVERGFQTNRPVVTVESGGEQHLYWLQEIESAESLSLPPSLLDRTPSRSPRNRTPGRHVKAVGQGGTQKAKPVRMVRKRSSFKIQRRDSERQSQPTSTDVSRRSSYSANTSAEPDTSSSILEELEEYPGRVTEEF